MRQSELFAIITQPIALMSVAACLASGRLCRMLSIWHIYTNKREILCVCPSIWGPCSSGHTYSTYTRYAFRNQDDSRSKNLSLVLGLKVQVPWKRFSSGMSRLKLRAYPSMDLFRYLGVFGSSTDAHRFSELAVGIVFWAGGPISPLQKLVWKPYGVQLLS